MFLDITNHDIELCKKRFKKKYIRIFLLSDEMVTLDELQGECISGDISIDAGSETRRTANLTLYSKDKSYNVVEYNKIWFKRRVKIEIGLSAAYDNNITWYNMGIFVFNNCSYAYGLDNKTISVQCADLTTLLDGTHGGILKEGESYLIKAGEDMKKVIDDLLEIHTTIKDYFIDTIGVYGCLQGKSLSWKQNRMDSGTSEKVIERCVKDGVEYLSDSPYLDEFVITTSSGGDIYAESSEEEIIKDTPVEEYIDLGSWHIVPYDLEFGTGTPIYEMIVKIRDLYPGYESYFDVDGQFILDLIPTCENDPVLLDSDMLRPLVVDENINIDFTTVKNATRIYGKTIETDRYANQESVNLRRVDDDEINGYILDINIEKLILGSNSTLGFQMPILPEYLSKEYEYVDTLDDVKKAERELPLYLYINSYLSKLNNDGTIEDTYTPYIIPCTIRKNVINTDRNSLESETKYTPMKISEFVSGESYSFKYVQNQKKYMYLGMYNIEAYVEDTSEESPFSIDKIGRRLQVFSGGEYDDIPDVILCKERAEYENWKSSRLNDVISLTTVLIPFLDVNQKVEYRSFSQDELSNYILKSISYSFVDNTCSITMNKYYDLYPFILCG